MGERTPADAEGTSDARSQAASTEPAPRGDGDAQAQSTGVEAQSAPAATLGPGESATSDPALFPRPLSRERIASWLQNNGFHYFVDVDGDVGGLWHSRVYFFFLFGDHKEIIQVRGQWNREIAIDRIEEVLEFCNEWNSDMVWPKAYIRIPDSGMIQVCAEVSADFEQGITDEQLAVQLMAALGSQSHFFDGLDGLYPDPAGSPA